MLKVEAVEAFPIRIRAQESLRGGTFSYSHYQTVLVRAVCDGVEGWGEAMTRFEPGATALMVRYLARELIGRELTDVSSAWGRVWHELRVRGHTRGVDVEALSGIEIALQDCWGKEMNLPIGRLYAEKPSEEVEVFAGSLFSSRGPLADQVQEVKAHGLKGAKVKIGFGVGEDVRVLESVRREWAEGMIVADANGAYDAEAAVRACAAFENLGLSWFEEPVLSDDWEGYGRLVGSKVRIGAGESWFVDDFVWPIERRLVGVLEPSVSRSGGIRVCLDLAKRASEKGIDFSPMTGMNSAISLAASLQVASARPSLGVEFNPFENPLQTELAHGISSPKDGRVKVPHGPGLGIEVDARFVRAHSE
jgi:galactonate dehydratase